MKRATHKRTHLVCAVKILRLPDESAGAKVGPLLASLPTLCCLAAPLLRRQAAGCSRGGC